jgi:hypothetical protein
VRDGGAYDLVERVEATYPHHSVSVCHEHGEIEKWKRKKSKRAIKHEHLGELVGYIFVVASRSTKRGTMDFLHLRRCV